MAIIPIWKDYQIVIPSSEDYVDFTINKIAYNGFATPIYSGRAYKQPGNGAISIYPNEICAPYVAMNMVPPPINGAGSKADYPMTGTFNLKGPNDFLAVWVFSAGWDYLEQEAARGSDPITGIVARDQVVILCSYQINGPVEYYFSKGGEVIYSGNISYRFPYKVQLLRPGDYKEADTITATSNSWTVEYRIVESCDPYILYYVNAYGGWDSLLVDGTVKQTDEYARTTYNQAYSTQYINDPGVFQQPRGTVCLQNDITRKYTLVTGWLTDDQASRMHHLLGSTNVYLLDRRTEQYVPVVLTNSSCEYKTYRNQGAQLVNYTIEATVAQTFTRR